MAVLVVYLTMHAFSLSIQIHHMTSQCIPGHVMVGGSASIKLFTFTDISGFLLILPVFYQLNFTRLLFWELHGHSAWSAGRSN